MKTNYQKALDLMEEAHYADPIDADILLRKATIYANLAVADALRDRSYA